ncbi:GSCOCT00013375001.2-RA-CDS [Cotesia congregata]|uniref:Cc_single_12.6 n=1 Tax=Cotesia congregata TaxID=51543 RepID=S6D320_COTCN|nr:GSCOCT00013375001.2-RA-CDS [Cotesia congregata]CAG5075263.1 cc_single_12.6 [Cotesia congregata]CCQ71334.1 hypothetical protein CcBV_12.6 [Cotesia congregata]
MNVTKQFCVVKFREMLFLETEEYQIVPSTWILAGSKEDAMIAFPLMNKTKLSDTVQKKEPPREKWLSFPASIEFETGEHCTT